MSDEPDFQRLISQAVQERTNFIFRNREAVLEAWVAQHGFNPDECVLMEQDMGDGSMRVWIEKRGDFDELRAFRAREDRLQLAAHEYACTALPSFLVSIAESLASDPTEGNDQAALAAEYAVNMRELERFQGREKLVQQLIDDVLEVGYASNEQAETIGQLRDFDLKGSGT